MNIQSTSIIRYTQSFKMSQKTNNTDSTDNEMKEFLGKICNMQRNIQKMSKEENRELLPPDATQTYKMLQLR